MSIKIWYQTEEQEFLHAEMQHYFEAVLQMQAEKASEQDADLKVIVGKRRYRIWIISVSNSTEERGRFRQIREGGSTDCRGIVFSMNLA